MDAPDFRALFEASPGLVVVLRADPPHFTILSASDAYLLAAMRERDSIVGHPVMVAFPDNPADPEATGTKNLRASLEKVIATGQVDRMAIQKYDIRRPDGTYEERFWSPLNAPMKGPTGATEFILHRVEDVTEVVRAESELAVRARELDSANRELRLAHDRIIALGESQLRVLFDVMPQLGWTAREDGTVEFYNRGWYEYTGTTYESMQGSGAVSIHHPDHVDSVVAGWRAALASGTPFEMEFPLRRHDGVFRWFLTRVNPVRDDEGKIVRWVGINTDIDDRRRAGFEERRALEASEELFRFLAEASAILGASLDYQDTLQTLAALVVPRHADWCSVEVLEDGQLIPVAVAHVDPEKIAWARELRARWPPRSDAPAGVYQVLRTGQSELYPHVSEAMIAAGSYDEEHLRISLALKLRSALLVPLIARGTTLGALTLVWSETERHYDAADVPLMEELGRRAGMAVDNARLYREAQKAIRLRDEFLSIASHELKTPLTSISLQLSALRRGLKSEAIDAVKATRRATTIDQSVHRLAALIEELLDVSRATSGQIRLEPTDLDFELLVGDAIEALQANLTAAGCELSFSSESGLRGRWDKARLDQIVTNLLSNALKYGPGKPIEVELRRVERTAVLRIRDHGIGVAAADQTRIFERFGRAVPAENYGGLGLGLWIAKQLVDAMGGTIEVESALGEGACFTVTLPLAD